MSNEVDSENSEVMAAEASEVTNTDGESESEVEIEEGRILAKGDGADFKWYVAHALSGFENRVKKTLKERIVNYQMTDKFAEIMVPEEEVLKTVNGKQRRMKKKFFPGYVLIKMVMDEGTWHLVKNTDKITGFLGGNKSKPTPISDEEAAYMTGTSNDGGFRKKKSSINYSEGDSVKVIEGPFATFVGTIEKVNEKGKLRVNVSIFGRPTPVELDSTQVERA